MSAEDADRFAESFRPSWRPSSPASSAPKARGTAARATPAAADEGERVELAEDQARLGKTLSGRRASLTAGMAIAGFVALSALGIMSALRSEPERPETTGAKPPAGEARLAPAAIPTTAKPARPIPGEADAVHHGDGREAQAQRKDQDRDRDREPSVPTTALSPLAVEGSLATPAPVLAASEVSSEVQGQAGPGREVRANAGRSPLSPTPTTDTPDAPNTPIASAAETDPPGDTRTAQPEAAEPSAPHGREAEEADGDPMVASLAPKAGPTANAKAPASPSADKPAEKRTKPRPKKIAEPPVRRTPAEVRVQIATAPAHARLFIGGRRVSNPYFGTAKGGGRLLVTARAPGYARRQLKVKLDRDRALAITLPRIRSEAAEDARRESKRLMVPDDF